MKFSPYKDANVSLINQQKLDENLCAQYIGLEKFFAYRRLTVQGLRKKGKDSKLDQKDVKMDN